MPNLGMICVGTDVLFQTWEFEASNQTMASQCLPFEIRIRDANNNVRYYITDRVWKKRERVIMKLKSIIN